MISLTKILNRFKSARNGYKDAFLVESSKHFDIKKAEKLFFSFDWRHTEGYHRNHFNRYLVTLDYLFGQQKDSRVLELGASPFGLTLLMRKFLFHSIHPTTMKLEDREMSEQVYTLPKSIVSSDGREELKFEVAHFNIETHRWPFENDSYDLVVAAEVFEHLALDPMHAISEANRVLKPGGRLFITVPNAIGYSNLIRVIKGLQPNSFPPFRPKGINLRHNRELTPSELSTIFWAGGFDVELMKTVNVLNPEASKINSILFFIILLTLPTCKNRMDFLIGMGKKSGKVRERFPVKYNLYCPYDIEDLKKNLKHSTNA